MRPIIAAVLIFASIQSFDCQSGNINSRLNYFDIDLLRYVAEGKSGNVMVSPASVKSMLALLLQGAQGPTATEIQSALRLSPNIDDYRQELTVFMKDLKVNTSSVTVQNANGLFVSKKLPLRKDYEMMAKNLFYAEVNNLDFNDPKNAADSINGWVNTNTKGLIPNIIDPAQLSSQSEMVVTNALYFKGTWLHQFALRPEECFFKDNVCRKVAMMELDAELRYAYVDHLRAHALELPYEGKRYSMMLLVPSDRDAGVALIRDLPYIGLLQINSYLQPSDVLLTMPKFTVEFGDDLAGALKNMKITTLFSPAANLSGIFQNPRASGQLNSVYHKVYMQVDEKGTVAAAATAGQVVPLINSFVNLRIDRPFLFFIWDNEKGVVLFEGKIEEPTEVVHVSSKPASNGINGQQGVKIHSIPNPVTPQLTPSGPVYSQSVPIQQQAPINPYGYQVQNVNRQSWNQPTSGQPIHPIVNQRVNGQPNQPIQPANQPIPFQLFTEPPTISPPTTQKSQENVKDKPFADPINFELPSGEQGFNNYIPIYQLHPIKPIVDQNVTSQSIQPVKNQPGDSQPNQPIQPTDQPIESADQPTKPADQPIKSADQPTKPADQPIKSADQPTKPADQSIKPADQPIKPADQPIKPSDQSIQAEDQPIQPADQPIQPAKQPIQPETQLIQTEDQPIQPADQKIQPADQPIQPADQPIPPADQPILPAEQLSLSANEPFQAADQPIVAENTLIYPVDQPIQSVDQLTQSVNQPFQHVDQPIQAENTLLYPADQPIQPVDQLTMSANQPFQSEDQPIWAKNSPIYRANQPIQPAFGLFPPAVKQTHKKYEPHNWNNYRRGYYSDYYADYHGDYHGDY